MTANPAMLPRPVRAVIFDMDGTLHDTEVIYHAATKAAVAAIGYSITDEFCHSMIGLPGVETSAMLCAHLGEAFPFSRFEQLWIDHIETAWRTTMPLKPGAADAVRDFTGLGLKLAVATSARRQSAETQLTRSGLRPHFPVVVARDDVPRGKPHPDLFLRAAALLGVAPEECLAVEDSLNGIRAAHAAGTLPVMVPDLVAPTEEIRAMCVHVARDLHEVRVLVSEQVARFV